MANWLCKISAGGHFLPFYRDATQTKNILGTSLPPAACRKFIVMGCPTGTLLLFFVFDHSDRRSATERCVAVGEMNTEEE